MNIKYVFGQEQTTTSPLLDVSIFSEASGNLYPGITKEAFSNNIELIEKRIDAIQKELSYWDLYKITSKVSNPDDLDAVYNNLVVGQSLVIECESFVSTSGQQLHRGDVVVKLSSEDAALIPSVNNGYYRPNVSADSSGLVFSYTYCDGMPTAGATQIVATVSLASVQNSFIYGISADISANATYVEFKTYRFTPPGEATAKLVYPVIKFFNKQDGKLEEMSYDAKPSVTGTGTSEKWRINFDSKPSLLNFIQVK